ncbi:unnamed protein product [Dibothriocephalus latus]|uniref:Uncharacterized protein n=1 Tax=Dibothriocephalus latus TaxID=60516 RepID=A0A3P6RIV2_DIBLA|nr:unnamed protein product [Dibothriocephalus latus]
MSLALPNSPTSKGSLHPRFDYLQFLSVFLPFVDEVVPLFLFLFFFLFFGVFFLHLYQGLDLRRPSSLVKTTVIFDVPQLRLLDCPSSVKSTDLTPACCCRGMNDLVNAYNSIVFFKYF